MLVISALLGQPVREIGIQLQSKTQLQPNCGPLGGALWIWINSWKVSCDTSLILQNAEIGMAMVKSNKMCDFFEGGRNSWMSELSWAHEMMWERFLLNSNISQSHLQCLYDVSKKFPWISCARLTDLLIKYWVVHGGTLKSVFVNQK